VWAWLRTVDPIALAQTLDRTHDLHDRLSTALSLGPKERNAFEEAQIRDASKHLAEIDLRRASPWQRPAEMVAFGVSAAILLGVWYFQAPDYKRPLPPELVIRHEKIMDDATLALERERLEALKQALESAGLEDSEELVQALDELLDKAERQEISEKQFLEELERIEKKYLENDDESRQDIADKLKEAAEKLEKEMGKDLAKDPEAKALVDALKNKDYEKAAEAMDALAKKLQDPNLSSKDLERLAKMMEKFSDLIDPNDPNLQKLIEENQALVDKLQRKCSTKTNSPTSKRSASTTQKNVPRTSMPNARATRAR
jgi:DNA repair exonuclease SbcCD ATPase subunit